MWIGSLLMAPEARAAGRRAVLVKWLRDRAERARRRGCRLQMDNRTASADRAFVRWRTFGEIADLLEAPSGAAPPKDT